MRGKKLQPGHLKLFTINKLQCSMLTYAQPGLPATCSARTLPGQWHTDHEWQPSQRKADVRRMTQGILVKYTIKHTIPVHPKSFTSTLPSGKPNLFWTTAVNSLILRPFSPSTFWVLETVKWTANKYITIITCTKKYCGSTSNDNYLVARMMISVLVGVTRTSTPEYPSSASSRVRNSFSSALKMPSETN